MVRKKKICAGCEQEQYIYKNIDGKKYCRSCAYKLQPPKAIKKVSEKQAFKITLKKKQLTEDWEFYMRVWNGSFGRDPSTGYTLSEPKCLVCGTKLGVPTSLNFHHILEKRNYPEYRYDENNIAIVCADCHSSYESNPDNIPKLVELREYLQRQHIIKQIINRKI